MTAATADPDVLLNIGEMIDLAIGTPEIGVVDFGMLHTVLHCLAQQLHVVNKNVELRGSIAALPVGREAVQTIAVSEFVVDTGEKPTKLGTESTDEGKLEPTPHVPAPSEHQSILIVERVKRPERTERGKKMDSTKATQKLPHSASPHKTQVTPSPHAGSTEGLSIVTLSKFNVLENIVDDLRERVYGSLPKNEDILEEVRSQTNLKAITDMWTSLNVSSRLEAAETGIAKLSSLLQDLISGPDGLQDAFKEHASKLLPPTTIAPPGTEQRMIMQPGVPQITGSEQPPGALPQPGSGPYVEQQPGAPAYTGTEHYPQHPGAVPLYPGAIPQQSGAVPQQPGGLTYQLGSVPQQLTPQGTVIQQGITIPPGMMPGTEVPPGSTFAQPLYPLQPGPIPATKEELSALQAFVQRLHSDVEYLTNDFYEAMADLKPGMVPPERPPMPPLPPVAPDTIAAGTQGLQRTPVPPDRFPMPPLPPVAPDTMTADAQGLQRNPVPPERFPMPPLPPVAPDTMTAGTQGLQRNPVPPERPPMPPLPPVAPETMMAGTQGLQKYPMPPLHPVALGTMTAGTQDLQRNPVPPERFPMPPLPPVAPDTMTAEAQGLQRNPGTDSQEYYYPQTVPISTADIMNRLIEIERKLKECCESVNKQEGVVRDHINSFQDQLVYISRQVASNQELASNQLSPDVVKDFQGMMKLFQTVQNMQEELKHVHETARQLAAEKEDRQDRINAIIEQIEILKTVKLDREDMAEAIAEKADLRMLARKVSHDQFELACDDLSRGLEHTLGKLNMQEALWQQALDDIQREIETKLDKMELHPVKEFFNSKLKQLQENLKQIASLRREVEAAGTKKKLLRDVNCISCDAKAVMSMEADAAVPTSKPLPAYLSMKPYLSYELDAIRKTQASNLPQRNLHDWEHIEKQVTPSRMPQKVRSESDKHLCNRYCGGSHTVTTPAQRVARVGHFIKQWGPDVLPLSSGLEAGEDGKMYKVSPVKDTGPGTGGVDTSCSPKIQPKKTKQLNSQEKRSTITGSECRCLDEDLVTKD